MRYSDLPISKPSQDLLGRSEFALHLAKAIDELGVAQDGFVIAIIGEWGSGKSSVVELIIRYLRHLEMVRASELPVLDDAHPNPKTLRELEGMCLEYEKIEPRVIELDSANKNITYWERINRRQMFDRWLKDATTGEVVDRYFQLKLNVDTKPQNIILRFSPWLIAGRAELAQALLSDLARAINEKLGSRVDRAFGKLLERLSELMPVVGAGVDLVSGAKVSKLFSAAGKWSGSVATAMTTGPTLDETREQLRSSLRALEGQKIIVIVDDLDRLTPSEALEMVSLVKSLGDLPNIVYVLTYDDARLADLLSQATGIEGHGHEYLEKIVQYPVHMPLLEGRDLSNLLDADLANLFGPLTASERNRLGTTWEFVLQYYLTTPRHVRRFVNAMSMKIAALNDYIDRVDMTLVTILELYEPEIHDWLRRNLYEVSV